MMKIDRAIEILNPDHRKHYKNLEEVNEACRMGMEALERTRWIPCSERMPEPELEVLVVCRRGGVSFVCPAMHEDGTIITETLNGVTKNELQHALQWLFEHYQFDV